MVLLFYTTYISVDLAHQVIFHAKVGKGGINSFISRVYPMIDSFLSVSKINSRHHQDFNVHAKRWWLLIRSLFCKNCL